MIVIKFGGHAMSDENGEFSLAIAQAIRDNIAMVIVHGGGPQIDEELRQRGISSIFAGGFRVTTPEIFDVVEEVLVSKVAPMIIDSLDRSGVQATALSGRASGILKARKLKNLVDGSEADLGHVGIVTSVDTKAIEAVLDQNRLPVVSPVASEELSGQGMNVNADLAAAAIAGALDASALIIMTDVAGIYRAWPDPDSLITEISSQDLREIKSTFEKGMAPKVQACLDALSAGASAVRIIDGRRADSLSQALMGSGGTLVRK
jgi:acetylglutamate kinase